MSNSDKKKKNTADIKRVSAKKPTEKPARRTFLTKLTKTILGGGVLLGGGMLKPKEVHAICEDKCDTCDQNFCLSINVCPLLNTCNVDGCRDEDSCNSGNSCNSDQCYDWDICDYANSCYDYDFCGYNKCTPSTNACLGDDLCDYCDTISDTIGGPPWC